MKEKKTRPIVVAFNHFPDKMLIKQKAGDLWKEYNELRRNPRNPLTTSADGYSEPSMPSIQVREQFPKEIQERRKLLIPIMIKAKQDGKSAYLTFDKLYINNKMYTVDTASRSGYAD